MIIKLVTNKNVLTYQYDDSVEGIVPQMPDASDLANEVLAGLPTAGISTDPIPVDCELFINIGALTEIRVFDDFDNAYALGGAATEQCTKNIVFFKGMQATILAFDEKSEGEYQRIRRIINEYYEAVAISK